MNKEDKKIRLDMLLETISNLSEANKDTWDVLRTLKSEITVPEMRKIEDYILNICKYIQYLIDLYRHLKEED